MSVEVVRGGQRRIDRVLDPGFVAGVGQLDLAELHARREEAEEADISFLRRLLQGRLDILRAELDVEELTRAVEVLTREEESVSGHRRAVQRVVDLLRGELARRYRDGSAQVSQLLE
jgi:hypothetical protein